MSKKNSEWSNYTGRLLWAMSQAGKSNQSELARAVGVKPQSIQYLCDPNSGARGSSHTPSLARELGVDAEWLATGQGHPGGGNVVTTREAPAPGYAVRPSKVSAQARLPVTGAARLLDPSGVLQRADLPEGQTDGVLTLPWLLSAQAVVLRVQGSALSPCFKDGQFLVLQAVPDLATLEPEDTLLILLNDGRCLLRELMVVRDASLLVLPVTGGQVEHIARDDIAGIELLVCTVPRRWWRAVG